ncbi:MAG TPA: hypothetical protein VFE78_06180 [Gemmataceae bacterium]|jgi:hypothetical protein|nr:hypothetical protein [Gemmataceae bacterium]
MNPWRWVDPRALQVRVADLKAYLLGRGWALQPNPNPTLLRFQRAPDGEGPALFQMVPASEQFADYHQRITELLTTLSEIEGRHPVAVLNDVLRGATTPRSGNGAEQAGDAAGARKR